MMVCVLPTLARLSIIAGLILAASARPILEPSVIDHDVNLGASEHIGEVEALTESDVSPLGRLLGDMASSLAVVLRTLSACQPKWKAAGHELHDKSFGTGISSMAKGGVDVVHVGGVHSRMLLQSGGNQQSPTVYSQGLLVSPFLSIVMGAAICVGLCVFLSVCRVVVRHRFSDPLVFEATATQDAPSAGLPLPILKSLPLVSFKREGDSLAVNQGSGENQCPICLIEFEPKDNLRKLPECSHYFHQRCVDEWFKRHHTCPLCRTSLLPVGGMPAVTSPEDAASAPAETPALSSSPGDAAVSVAALEQEAGQAAPHFAPVEREGPVARH